MSIVIFLITSIILFLIGGLLYWNGIYNRAHNSGIRGYKEGMVVDREGNLRGTSTPVYRDPKTGISILGETRLDK